MPYSTGRIIINVFTCLLFFYCAFYFTATVVFGAFRLQKFDGTIPFHYESFDDKFYQLVPFNQSAWTSQPFLSDIIALESTYFISTWVYIAYLDSWLWDYALTVTVIHCAIVCAVNVTFPLIWEWWVCVCIGLIFMMVVGESIKACVRQRKKGKFDLKKNESKA
ncbi:putative transmembrane protein 244 [Saccoglossus kowalevskii]|uniref:Transmembrane protein 244-like n=1 Tax=Saccoglossus kowalevskii TaxID=10224 RepID=A0ABM0M1B5_SACKO|nr:PREDICTED: transmembrane protein 244-like [Saccoglossus kowalevskii]